MCLISSLLLFCYIGCRQLFAFYLNVLVINFSTKCANGCWTHASQWNLYILLLWLKPRMVTPHCWEQFAVVVLILLCFLSRKGLKFLHVTEFVLLIFLVALVLLRIWLNVLKYIVINENLTYFNLQVVYEDYTIIISMTNAITDVLSCHSQKV